MTKLLRSVSHDKIAVKADQQWATLGTSRRQTLAAAFAESLTMFSVSTQRKKILFRVFLEGGGEGGNPANFIEFLECLIKGVSHKIFLIVDTQRVQCAPLIDAWAELRKDRIELFYLPSIPCT